MSTATAQLPTHATAPGPQFTSVGNGETVCLATGDFGNVVLEGV